MITPQFCRDQARFEQELADKIDVPSVKRKRLAAVRKWLAMANDLERKAALATPSTRVRA